MKAPRFDINNLKVASPCQVPWDGMKGDERTRHCDSCKLNVFNISDMTAIEAEHLIQTREGRLCIRLYKRADGTVITKDCPVGFRAYQKRAAKFAGAALGAILGLFSISFGQKEDKPIDATKIKILRVATNEQNGEVSGTLFDAAGAVIPGAKMSLFNEKGEQIVVTTNVEGTYQFSELPAGKYSLKAASPGFANYQLKDLSVGKGEKLSLDIVLKITGEVVGLLAVEPDAIDTTSSSVTTTITLRKIETIPHR